MALKERLNSVFLDMTKKLDDPDFTHAIASFVKTYESIKTDSAMVSALSSFGKSLQTKVAGCKRARGDLQTSTEIGAETSVSAVLSSGQPTKAARKEHA